MNRFLFLILNSSLFAISMGWLEGVVVVYLRSMHPRVECWKIIEISREAATLIMLICFSHIAGNNRRERLGILLWIFGVWDILYYVCLWTWLNWPASLATMDTLFYIPCTWSAPVWVPVLFALMLMLIGYYLIINRWSDLLTIGGWWLLFGSLIGAIFGVFNAWLSEISPAVSIMGVSVCLGLIGFGAGIGNAIGGKLARDVFLAKMTITIIFGIAGGMLGHIARSMFYHSHYSFWWPVSAGIVLGTTGLILQGRYLNTGFGRLNSDTGSEFKANNKK